MREAQFPSLTPCELADVGRALYGAHWRSELARVLGLPDERLIRAVEAGELAAPSEWRAQLVAIAQDMALRAMEAASTLLWREERKEDASTRAANGKEAPFLT